MFWDEDGEGEGDNREDDEWEDSTPGSIADCDILRDIVMLRVFNGAHPNLMRFEDSTTTKRRTT